MNQFKEKTMKPIKEGDILTLIDGTKVIAVKSNRSACGGCIFSLRLRSSGMLECSMADALEGELYRCWEGETEFIFKEKKEE